MKITVDFSGFDGPWKEIRGRMEKLPDVITEEISWLAFKTMTEHTPVETGWLTSTVIGKRIQPGVWHVGPTAWYAPYPLLYGKRKTKYTTGYHERTMDAIQPLLQDTANARAEEYLRTGA